MSSTSQLPTTVSPRPRLRFDLNSGNLANLPADSAAPKGSPAEVFAGVRAAGYEGLQGHVPDEAAIAAGLKLTGMGRVLKPADADEVARRHRTWGYELSTLHVGGGLETDDEIDALVGAVLEAQARHGYPMYIETHRATVTQDMRRTLDLIDRFPEVRFNADLSHWYTGHEMTYGDIVAKFDALEPVFERVRYMHGRIGDSSNAQTSVLDGEGQERPQVGHFREMWTRCAAGFLRTSDGAERLMFAPELLPATAEFGGQTYILNYARLLPGGREETDRWTEALKLCAIAAECFAAAELTATQ